MVKLKNQGNDGVSMQSVTLNMTTETRTGDYALFADWEDGIDGDEWRINLFECALLLFLILNIYII